VSRFQKILLAFALVAIGFGVAKFLGQPVLRTRSLSSRSTQAPLRPISTPVADSASRGAIAADGARLLPGTSATPAHIAAMNTIAKMPESPALGSPIATASTTNDAAPIAKMPQSIDCVPISLSPINESRSPRATLRNEAPRAIGVDPQSPVAIHRTPPVSLEAANPVEVANAQAESVRWPAPPLLTSSTSAAKPSSPAAIRASYDEPGAPLAENQVAPPPWPNEQEYSGPRTHIVVDGDSLEKLASRYLSDPRRSHEIYELNRDVLTAPDLLPIGAELKIPERVASASIAREGFPPNSGKAQPNREVVRDNWAPVRPASSPQGIIPRAQLAPPVMVQ
jgi:LysM domain